MAELRLFDDDKVTQELVLGELDAHIQELFSQICVRKCGVALVRFLEAHANSLHTTQDIAFYLRADDTDVACGLSALAELGLAHAQNIGGLAFFGATTDPAVRQLIRDLCLWQDRWQGRIARIEQLVFGAMQSNDRKRLTDD